MHILVFGANGKVGSLVVDKLLSEGHKVRAFVYSGNLDTSGPNLKTMKGDVRNPQDVSNAIVGMDAVVSCLGSWGTKTKDIVSSGMENIVPAMKKIGLKRIVSLTGHDARAKDDSLSITHKLSHFTLRLLAGKILSDGEKHLVSLNDSGLDWTVIRSPIMTNSTNSNYRILAKRPLPFATIPRIAVAQAVTDQVSRDTEIKKAIYIGR